MSWKVFAEDEATGLTDQSYADFGDGANFGAQAHDANAADYAPVEPTLTTDFGVPEVTLSEAQYRVTAQNVSTRNHEGNTVTWPEVTFVIHAPSVTESLTDNTTNYIFLDVDLTTQGDDAKYVVKTSDSAPASPSLKVAEVDTSGNTATVENADPNGSFDELDTTIQRHATNIDEDYTVPAGTGTVVAGSLSGSGSISGNGNVSVIEEGHNFTDNVDANNNDISNVGSLSTEKAKTAHPNDEREFTFDLRKNERSTSQSSRETIDLFLDAEFDEDRTETHFNMVNGIQLNRYLTSSQVSNISGESSARVSEVLKFLEDGDLAIENDVEGGLVQIQNEKSGKIRLETENSSGDKRQRLVITGEQNDLERARFTQTEAVKIQEFGPDLSSDTGHLILGLDDSNGDGYSLEFTGSTAKYEIPNTGDVHRFIAGDGQAKLDIDESDVSIKGRVDFNGNTVRGNGAEGSLALDGGVRHLFQRGDPSTSELGDGQCMTFNSDGTGTGSAGDLIYAVNDSGTIKTSIISQRSNATA